MKTELYEKIKQNFNIRHISSFPYKELQEKGFIPLMEQRDSLLVGVLSPDDKENLAKVYESIKQKSSLKPQFVTILPEQFQTLLDEYGKHLDSEVDKVVSIVQTLPVQVEGANPPKRKRLGELLVDSKLITESQLLEALAASKETQTPLGSVLARAGIITIEELRDALALQQGVETVNSADLKITEELMELLPEDFIKDNKVVPLSSDGKILKVGMVHPDAQNVLNEIIYITQLTPKPLLITHFEFEKLIEKYFKSKKETQKIIAEIESEEGGTFTESLWDQVEKELHNNQSVVSRFANKIITDGIDKKASDVHIEPRGGKYIVRYRIDGILRQVMEIPEKVESSLISRFKVLARMNIAEHRRTQDGTFSLRYKNISYDFRLNTLPVDKKEKMVIRILQPSVSVTQDTKEIKIIGASKYEIDKIEIMTTSPNGIILTSGPTGSGKTTTLYSMLSSLNEESVNITTIEDPIEIRLEGINQTQVNPKADITFASCMRAILRQDPDIIMVGEIRDYETLEAAISAALTGHLVLSTIHTNSAAATITRLMEMGAADYLVSATLAGVIAQRLVRKVCPKCREEYIPSDQELSQILINKEDYAGFLKYKIYKPVGCEFCDYQGYAGRLGVYEVLMMNKEIKKLIAKGAADVEIEEAAVSCGMRTLQQACLEHIMNGQTTITEFVRVLGMANE